MERHELLLEYFFNRTDCAAVVPVGWKNPCPVDMVGTAEQLVLGHLAGDSAPSVTVRRLDEKYRGEPLTGHFRLGSYTPDLLGNTLWLVIDIDGAGHSEPVADPLTAALAIRQRFEAVGITVYLEQSGGGHGWHLWVFFDAPVSAAKVRRLALALIPPDITLANGGNADPAKCQGVEIFPKAERIAEDGYGNLVYLPWWSGAKNGANQFYQLQNGSGPQPFTPDAFETVSEEAVDRALAEIIPPRDEPQRPRPERKSGGEAWSQWRKAALAALALEDVYGPWLTGKCKRTGWLECRDPQSPSGDQTPSAGVSEGNADIERGTFHSFRDGRTLSVFDFLIERGQATDFKDACQVVARLSGVETPLSNPPRPPSELPTIQINNRQLRDSADDAWRAILAENADSPSLFVRGGDLVRIAERDGHLCIEYHNEASVIGHLARVANWVSVSQKGTSSVSPSKDIARTMLAYPSPRLPRLEAILNTPIFSGEGDLLDVDGYHANHGLWLDSVSEIGLLDIPQEPSEDHIARARALICEELLGDFPFVEDADRAHIVAALLLPIIRRMIAGVTPLHVISAPVAGSGKGLLCDVISICHTGLPCPVQPISAKEEEIRKVITSQLSLARPIILLDNARERYRIDSASLAAALTADMWTDRILTESRIATLPNRALWLLTGNNPQFSTELARRSVRIRIDAQSDQPWRRSGFRIGDLRQWTQENRARILAAMFILVRAWQRAGRPHAAVELGTFERWSQVLGGILEVAGIPGFLSNLDDFYATSDDEGQMWRDFVRAWWDKYKCFPKRVAELYTLCDEQDLMIAIRSDGTAKSQETRLGLAIKRVCDRVYDGKKIALAKDSGGRGKHYQLRPVGTTEAGHGVTFALSVEPLEQGHTQGYTSEDQYSQELRGSV